MFARKYFYPLCSTFAGYRELPSAAPGRLPRAEEAAAECMTLPFYGGLTSEQVAAIVELIRGIRG